MPLRHRDLQNIPCRIGRDLPAGDLHLHHQPARDDLAGYHLDHAGAGRLAGRRDAKIQRHPGHVDGAAQAHGVHAPLGQVLPALRHLHAGRINLLHAEVLQIVHHDNVGKIARRHRA
ncbi:MAG: hypothetical protein BWY59_00593 [Verrucomicrobia bacterium ADurb.Bin345]|nr:MAG: hypothetical protein BWY59_00593 [Verrucomicrobia bacterium ADurb.Bin345]